MAKCITLSVVPWLHMSFNACLDISLTRLIASLINSPYTRFAKVF